ncbi:TPA: hypothetical protein N5L63_002835 [Enterobacter kobei]|uniref:hypothetical protein n=1 Tax=Enterobacter kobei TaxID=208224 RepID=UPI002875D29A|nr:hypothetical protein [Enterobacter kobei]HCM9339476.1 hypothetical protein [Enterobacter kobei]
MSNIDKRAQKELYAKVERQAHSLRGNPREYQAVTGLCPVNVIEMHAKKILALLDELEAKDKYISELKSAVKSADDRYENRTPTQWAYDQACLALEKHRARAEAAEKRIAELERKEQHSERQSVIDALAASGEAWSDIEEYMQKWDAERASAAGKGE